MLDSALMQTVATQLLGADVVKVGDETLDVQRVGRGRFRSVRFRMNGKNYQAIEQNPEKPSRWGQLARDGHKVVQFRDVATNQYVAVGVDGVIQVYEHRG